MLSRRQAEPKRPAVWAVAPSQKRPRRRSALLRTLAQALIPAGMFTAAAVGLALGVLVLGGLGYFVSRVVPLTAFQAAALMLAAGVAIFLVLLLQDLRDLLQEALFEEEEEEADEPAPKPFLHPVLPFPKEDIVEPSGKCPCGSGRKYENCCGAGAR
ncbi:MAG: hypothetical protein COZ06_05580 [Armatimonadetes bacterium CG_4_10_14_3_um_filter_66_18]|nr:MAG: hypothetical protein COZ57_33905 [Armatimonadetes bacterium CG_4_8_14_3_um_filter_66_20]PIY51171.1 MAG: hypothetical protein COZ06_05580 [Armatimonadetes bacterium CG_4_10_14_3_um_filter_66_18]PIZ38914.1 MAG: hypothetical protein COY42_22825 [Armatimonadetes bacterium CG_4_10_14_0_8_um_filter_66_14]PJB65809.1 MAG: hypothetical protein CO096_17860 [Armatimonadetes bacterium CG_4_9_14_3_um_filter_66_14]